MGKITAIATQKGGVSKTTTSINLAAGLAHKGKKVLLIDIDQQANSSKVLLPNYQQLSRDETIYATLFQKKPLTIHHTSVANLDIVPGHILLSDTDTKLSAEYKREERLKKQLDLVRDQYDYIFIDCPPALGLQTINALTAATNVLIVVAPGFFELDSLVQMSDTIVSVQEELNAELEVVGIAFTKSDPTVNSRESLRMLREAYGDKVLQTVIPSNVDVKDAHSHRKDIFTFNHKAPGALAYAKLIEEVFHE